MNYYPFHIGDYISHTSHLTDAEDLAYRRMIDLYYQSEQPFPDAEFVARRVKSTPEIVSVLLSEYFVKSEDGWRNKRADEEIEKYHAKAESARNANKAKLAKKSELKSELKSEPNQDATKNQEPRTNNQYIKEFYLFWDVYGKKRGKPNALKEWKKLPLDELLISKIIESAKKQATFVLPMFRKDPERWLKNKCWEDELISQNTVSKQADDKQWMFSDQGIVAKANELGVHSMGLSYQQLKEKCLLVMAKKAMQ